MADNSINDINTGTGITGTTGTTGSSGTYGSGGTATGAASALSQTAQDYGRKISEAATHAKDIVSDKVSVVSDKIKDLQNQDLGENGGDRCRCKHYAPP